MFLDKPLREYLDVAASDSPTPGGGSVAALAGALGSCMGSMAANFTAGRKKYAEVEDDVQAILATLATVRQALLQAMSDDATVFEAVGAAYKMPKETEEEKAARTAAIQESLQQAMAVPLEVMRQAVAALEALPRLAAIGNPNLVSDTGVAALLLQAATQAARLNVLINVVGLKDAPLAEATRTEMDTLSKRADTLAAETAAAVEAIILR